MKEQGSGIWIRFFDIHLPDRWFGPAVRVGMWPYFDHSGPKQRQRIVLEAGLEDIATLVGDQWMLKDGTMYRSWCISADKPPRSAMVAPVTNERRER